MDALGYIQPGISQAFTWIVDVAEEVPKLLEAVRDKVKFPGWLKHTSPGFCAENDEGTPPVKLQFHEVGSPDDASLTIMQSPTQI